MRRLAIPALVVALTAPALSSPLGAEEEPGAGAATPIDFDLTWRLGFDYHTDNQNARDDDDGYADLRNIAEAYTRFGDETLMLRVDTYTFFDPPDTVNMADPKTPYGNDYVLERIAWTHESTDWSMTVGDFHAVLGRGIALSVRKIDDLGIDLAIRGARASYEGDDLRTTVLGGFTNSTNLEPTGERLIRDSCTDSFTGTECNPLSSYPNDLVAGGRMERRLPLGLWLGAHYVHEDHRNQSDKRSHIAGASLELPDIAGLGELYLEYDELLMDGRKDGRAIYGQATFSWKLLTLLAELKDYSNLDLSAKRSPGDSRYSEPGHDFVLHQPPTLERIDQIIHDNKDIYGGRLLVSFRIPYASGSMSTVLRANRLQLVAEPPSSDSYDIHHTYGEVEHRFGFKAQIKASGGYRKEDGAKLFEMYHGEGQLEWAVWGRHSIKAAFKYEDWLEEDRDLTSAYVLNSKDYVKGDWSVGYGFAPSLSVAYIQGFDTTDDELTNRNRQLELVNAGVEREEALQRAREKVAQTFHAVEIAWEPCSYAALQLIAGSTRGGLRCVSGVCRTFPPFTGVRTMATLRY